MGKGDKKTRRGKIHIGSYGNRRKRNSKKATVADVPTKQNSTKTISAEEQKSSSKDNLVEG